MISHTCDTEKIMVDQSRTKNCHTSINIANGPMVVVEMLFVISLCQSSVVRVMYRFVMLLPPKYDL